jgi:hypothetical protein
LFRPFLLLAVVAFLAAAAEPRVCAVDGADAEPPLSGHWQIRGALRDADDALEEGRLDAAGQLYRQVVASTSAGDDRRAQALYGVVLVEMIERSTSAEAGAALEELASSFPDFERGPEVAAARACLAELDRAGGRTEDLTERIAELEAELAERTARLAARDAAAGDRVAELEAEGETLRTEGEALRTQLAELQEKLSGVEEELRKKEEALEKVKKTLVSGG